MIYVTGDRSGDAAMGITLREALDLGILPKARVIAGRRGLDRQIHYVDIMEVPDPDDYIRQGLLCVSSWYAIRGDEEAQLRLVKAAANAGAAGFVLKVKRYLGRLSQRVIDLADECGLPIIEIEGDEPYVEITHPLLTKIISDQAFRLEYYLKAHKLFRRVALEGGSYDAIAEALYSLIHNPVILCDAEGKLLAWFCQGEECGESSLKVGMPVLGETDIKDLSHVDHYTYRESGLCTGEFLVFPIRVEADIYGYWLVCEANKVCTELDFIALENASTIAALETTKRAAVSEIKSHLRHDFVDELIRGVWMSEETAQTRALALGWEFIPPVGLIVADIDGFAAFLQKIQDEEYAKQIKLRMLAVTQEVVASHSRSHIVIGRSDSCIAVVSLPSRCKDGKADSWLLKVAEQLQTRLRAELAEISVSIAISQPYLRLVELRSGYLEACELMDICRIVWGPGQIATKEKLDIYRLFYHCGSQGEMAEFCSKLLSSLVKGDTGSRTELIHTLRVYLECGASITKTAQSLFIHENTLRYRLKKIEKVTGLDLKDSKNCFKLALALHILPFLKD
ncbi:MAG: PucR family transcriptional regulator ligand-binding domain-containing protein [Bacillota bacterium]